MMADISLGKGNVVDLVNKGVLRVIIRGFIAQFDGIVGLFILTPAHVADKAGVIQQDTLAAQNGGKSGVTVADLGAVYFVVHRVGHHIVSRVFNTVFIDQSTNVFHFDQHFKAIYGAAFGTKPRAQSERGGFARSVIGVV